MRKSEKARLKTKKLGQVVLERMKENLKCKKMRELAFRDRRERHRRRERVGLLSWAPRSTPSRRAVTRFSHTRIAWKEYDVNTYVCGKSIATGGSGPSGCERLKKKEVVQARFERLGTSRNTQHRVLGSGSASDNATYQDSSRHSLHGLRYMQNQFFGDRSFVLRKILAALWLRASRKRLPESRKIIFVYERSSRIHPYRHGRPSRPR